MYALPLLGYVPQKEEGDNQQLETVTAKCKIDPIYNLDNI